MLNRIEASRQPAWISGLFGYGAVVFFLRVQISKSRLLQVREGAFIP
jgi:hypothetical protein